MFASPPSPPACVAVVRFSAAGDVLLASQAIDALAAAWPQARLVFVTHARFAPLQAHNPHLAGIVALPRGGCLRTMARALRRDYAPDAVLDLHGSWRSRLLGVLLRPKRKAVWQKRSWREWAQVRLAGGTYNPTVPMATRLHAAVEELVGHKLPAAPFRLHLPPSAAKMAAQAAPVAGGRARRVGLSPGAGWATKRWPVGRYVEVARALVARGHEVVLFGSEAERELTRQVARAVPGCHDLAGQLDWSQTFAALAQLDVLVAGDTGPMHLARGLGVGVVALFTSTPAGQFHLEGGVALQAHLACSPCSFYGRSACPRGHAACLAAIAPEVVVEAVDGLLRAREAGVAG